MYENDEKMLIIMTSAWTTHKKIPFVPDFELFEEFKQILRKGCNFSGVLYNGYFIKLKR